MAALRSLQLHGDLDPINDWQWVSHLQPKHNPAFKDLLEFIPTAFQRR
jgi:hypothetical protein